MPCCSQCNQSCGSCTLFRDVEAVHFYGEEHLVQFLSVQVAVSSVRTSFSDTMFTPWLAGELCELATGNLRLQ